MNNRVALYARVSTLNQAEAQTIDQQLERLHNYVKEQGWQLSDEHIYRGFIVTLRENVFPTRVTSA